MAGIWQKLLKFWPNPQNHKNTAALYILMLHGFVVFFWQALTQAMGIDADMTGFDKKGEEIERLKSNGALALFFFANPDKTGDLFQNA